MPGINIPGVTDKYNTSSTVEKLMQIERIPLTREQKTLDTYKAQQDAWQNVNRKMTSLRDSVKGLYSFGNPFNNKLASSTDEYAVTAEATRNAAYESFKIDVIQPASADRFLSSELDEETKVPAGTYTYKVAGKAVSMRWKGGSLQDFSAALNRRGSGLIQSRVIGASRGKKTISIESLKTGEENRLAFEDDAKTFAETSGMIAKAAPKDLKFSIEKSEFRPAPPSESSGQDNLPAISQNGLKSESGTLSVPPRSGFELRIPDSVKETPGAHIYFTISGSETEDIAEALNKKSVRLELPNSGSVSFKDITIRNSPFDAALSPQEADAPRGPIEKVKTDSVLTAVYEDGSEKEILLQGLSDGKKIEIDLNLDDHPGIKSLVMRNWNTGTAVAVSALSASNPNENLGFVPQHPISKAADAIIKYEGITIRRPDNAIDDVVPEVTLNIHEKTERTATISIAPDAEAAKEALIMFVGKYNQAISEINILSQNRQEIVDELDYLSEDERKEAQEKLGMFLDDTSLSNLKSNLQAAAAASYPSDDSAEVTMLSQIGISTNAASYSGYSPGKLRGYLEIDEKKLDAELKRHPDEIRRLFGCDTDGDLIIDSGIGYRMDKQLTAYVQTGGIFALKTSGLDSKIKSSEQKIASLEQQMKKKEAELRSKYGQMEGALNSLESQQTAISNFSNRNNNQN